MITKQELEQIQLEFERDLKLNARRRYNAAEHKMVNEMKGGYLSGTDRGRATVYKLLEKYLPRFQELTVEHDKIINGNAKIRRDIKWLNAVLLSDFLGSEVVLGISLKTLIDQVGKYKRISACDLAAAIGSRLKTEMYRQIWEQHAPEMMAKLEQKYKDAGVWHKMKAAKVILAKETGLSCSEINSHFGSVSPMIAAEWGISLIAKDCGFFDIEPVNVSKKKTMNMLKFNKVFETWYEKTGHKIEKELQVCYPMICQPRDWDLEGKNGGYLEPVGRVADFIKREKGRNSKASPTQIQFVNNLQKTEWELNRFTCDVMDQLWHTEYGGQLGSFKPTMYHPDTHESMPPELAERASDDPERLEWRRYMRTIHTANSESRRNGVRSLSNISAVHTFESSGFDTFYIPYASDTRGRVYVLSAGALSPQGCDHERSLLRFAKGQPVTPNAAKWLAIHCANMYGINESHAAKAEWVEANKDLIKGIALDPLDHLETIEIADEPWQFMAACDELYNCVLNPTRDETHLPIAMDATASGAQILALLARDKDCAKKVNLVPGFESKQDIYADLKPLLKEEIENHPDAHSTLKKLYIPRKTFKANLMTRLYGSTKRSRRQAIKDSIAIAYNHQYGVLQVGDAQILTDCFENAMKRLAGSALDLYDDIQKIGKHLRAKHQTASWTTPTGTYVEIAPYKNQTTRIDLGWFGNLRISDTNKPQYLDAKKVSSSLAPNFVHSLDASILHYAFKDWTRPLGTTHDCFSCLATDVEDALALVLGSFQYVLKDNRKILDSLAESNDYPHKDWSIVDTYTDQDMDNISQCVYAFC